MSKRSEMSTRWPSTPLHAAQRAFDLLTCPPAPLAFDCRGIAGLPQEILPLDELKTVLIQDCTSCEVRDVVWRELVTRARRDGPAWVVAAVGIAMPGLVRAAGFLSAGWRGDCSDRDSELLTGFLTGLRVLDVEEPRVCARLIEAGERAVKKARDHAEQREAIRVDTAWSLTPRQPWDHPDWVLARAVAAAVIDPEECFLVGATRLDDASLQDAADQLGVHVSVASAWRRAAEARLAEAIPAGEVSGVLLRVRSDRGSDTVARLNGLPAPRRRTRRAVATRPG